MSCKTKIAIAWIALLTSPLDVRAEIHNLVLFVPDGLRSQIVDSQQAPAMAELREKGVNFINSHSVSPTFTTANASAFATGHQLGDTGDFSNTIFTGFPVTAAGGSVTPFLESNPVLREVTAHFGGNYLNEESVVTAAAHSGRFSTAVIGKVGPTGIFDLGALAGAGTLIVDDSTGHDGGVPLSQDWLDAIAAAKLTAVAPGRGDNGNPGDYQHPGTWVPDYAQQQFFLEIVTKVVLPRFKAAGRPFVLVYWSRDPDGSQHNQGDSADSVRPGINGPTSFSAIRNADAALTAIEQALHALGLAQSTNLIVAADHGFSTIAKTSDTSVAARASYGDVIAGELPAGFLAIDLAAALKKGNTSIRLFDPDAKNQPKDWQRGEHPLLGNALIGSDAAAPQLIVAANGGSDLLYIPERLPERVARRLGAKVVEILLRQDYVSGLFVDRRRLGEVPGALSLDDLGLVGAARTPLPAIVVNFRSFSTGCENPVLCAAEIADTRLQQGQGMHGSFSRADTWNFMAARGPDFREHYLDQLPASNADIGRTMAHLLELDITPKGALRGRELSESLRTAEHEPMPEVKTRTLRSAPTAAHQMTILRTQSVLDTTYIDAAGFPGLTLGLEEVR
ncbi:MAG: alkaline phosphatase family protein [Gammaproteobacteria bacterium]|nr:alkaline phosphatase family protein [Gammaproteobacteria bacterium]